MRTSLSGVWKISASLRGKQSTVLPKRIRFEDTSENPPPPRQLPAMAVLDSGSCSVPYAEHCGGQYELWTPSNAEDSDELRAGFQRSSSATLRLALGLPSKVAPSGAAAALLPKRV